jgi:protein TonB
MTLPSFLAALRPRVLPAGALTAFLLAVPPARAQAVGPDTARVYTQVERMPELPNAKRRYTNREAVTAAIQRACRYPAPALREMAQGTVMIGFTVDPQGLLRDIRVEQGVRPDLDEATVAAVQTLPRFRPGTQGGRPVPVRYTLPIQWRIQ